MGSRKWEVGSSGAPARGAQGAGAPTYLLTYAPTYLLTYAPTYLLTHAPTYLLTYAPTHLCTDLRTHLQLERQAYSRAFQTPLYADKPDKGAVATDAAEGDDVSQSVSRSVGK